MVKNNKFDKETSRLLNERDTIKLLETDQWKLYGWNSLDSFTLIDITNTNTHNSWINLNDQSSVDWLLTMLQKAATNPKWAESVIKSFGRIVLKQDEDWYNYAQKMRHDYLNKPVPPSKHKGKRIIKKSDKNIT